MNNIARLFGAGVIAVFGIIQGADSPPALYAQGTSACADSTSDLKMYRDGYADMVSNPDTAAARQRTNLGLPTLNANQVIIVADTAACRAASIAYDNELGVATPTVPVMVLELATKRVVVKDSGKEVGPNLNILFNHDFTQVITRIWY